MVSKSTQVEINLRILKVQKLLLRGHGRPYIIRFAAKTWNISDRQTDDYITKASEEINEINKGCAEHNLAVITSNLWSMYRTYLKKKETANARTILLDIAKLRGLDRIDINLRVERPYKDVKDAELFAIVGDP